MVTHRSVSSVEPQNPTVDRSLVMDLFFAVGVLFGIGYAAGFGLRALGSQKRGSRYRPMSSLRDFDYREDPVWTR